MNLQKVTFQNKEGQNLVGRLELPIHQEPHNYAVHKTLHSETQIVTKLIK